MRILVIFLLFITLNSKSQHVQEDSLWVDSVFKTLNPDERITQLFMVSLSTTGDNYYFENVAKTICTYKTGGVIFFKRNVKKTAKWINALQNQADVPLLVGIDAEWGLSMRLDSTPAFPRQLTLGAIQNDSLIYQMGLEIGKECKRIGVHINFAPVVDINSNPKNPVINSRSFGENKYNVARKGLMYMNGIQDAGILACAKHFPGHGDTDTDSHLALPVIHHSKMMIDTLDLYPFKKLISGNVSSVMVGHLNVPSLDSSKNSISSLSEPIITYLLKKELGFRGLVISDALDMMGVSKTYKNGNAELKALQAGVDILLYPQNIPDALKRIKKAIDSSEISQSIIDEKCKKVLLYKYRAGLASFKPVKIDSLYEDLNSPEAENIQHELYEKSITLVKNDNNLIPLLCIDTLCIASVAIGDSSLKSYQSVLSRYAPVDAYALSKRHKKKEADSLMKMLSNYDLVIISLHNTTNLAYNDFGITQQTIDFIDTLRQSKKIILDFFANPYSLVMLKDTENIESIIVSYQDNAISEMLSAQIIFGGISCDGKLPVTASSEFPLNAGIVSDSVCRLKYTIPQELNISPEDLAQIDSIALKGIKEKAYPGCVVLVAKDGKVFYNKAFGYHTYENKVPMLASDIFDMASITKIAASTLAIMKLYDEVKLNIDMQLGMYLPILKKTNKEHIVIRDLLAHQAKLKAWIPFYKETFKNGKIDTNIYKKVKSEKYPYRVADSLYIRIDYQDSIIHEIIKSPLLKKKEYVYSDMGFYLMMKIVEKLSGEKFEDYLNENFYWPLGMSTAGFKPRERFELSRIVPTELDTAWRKQLVWGDVNDQGAAMMGGVCGHAGLFCNAYDIATLMQMLLQNGEYAGKKYLDSSTIAEFTKCQFPENKNRRGLGFDKPVLDQKESSLNSKSASASSYGHSGFTGTFFWVDPEVNLIYIFLSNRVYPDPNNKKITELGIRPDIHQAIYNAVANSEKK
ncbi:MAG: glycoside hydrolase family 3 N-terminal domain-containing protein [Bacteroidota bacterium]